MTRYLLLDLVFLMPIFAWLWRQRSHLRLRSMLLTLVVLVILTSIFDNVIISLGIVRYHPEHILGLYIGRIPIEDFAYSIAAAFLVPLLWRSHEK